jgi:RibD C-terminal domain
MRKIIVNTLVSLDGIVDDPPSWGSRDYKEDESLRDYLGEVSACDAMLFGRRGYESLFPIFSQRKDPWAARINSMNKYVFSSTLHETSWQNSKRSTSATATTTVVTRSKLLTSTATALLKRSTSSAPTTFTALI